MNTRRALILMAAAFAASCINYTGLEGDGSEYTKPQALGAGGGTADGGGSCQTDGLTTCSAATCDDGTSAAASLGAATLDCQYRSTTSNWADAMSYCAGLGSGWRLPSKGEALKIVSSPNVCRTSFAADWFSWTSTCAGARLAWYVLYDGSTRRGSVDYGDGALCVR